MNRLQRTAQHVLMSQVAEAEAGVETKAEVNTATIGSRRGTAAEVEQALKTGALKDTTVGMEGKPSDVLPGPMDGKSRDEVLLEIADASGQSHTQWMRWQQEYGDAGLQSNIVIPHIARDRVAGPYITEKVMLSDPDDCVRIARAHTEKEGNFQMLMGDSVISARDNNAWVDQRNHMTQAFLPMSSLAHIFPISNQRAVDCADILKRLSQGGTVPINMSEFFLNETQQQLHLALFGESNDDFDESYNATFRDSLGGPPQTPTYGHRHEIWREEQRAAEEAARKAAAEGKDVRSLGSAGQFLANLNKFIAKNKGQFAAPSDLQAAGIDATSGVARNADGSVADRKIRGPLSAVLAEKLGGGSNKLMEHVDGAQGGASYDQLDEKQQAAFNAQTDFGNAFIFAFAGHDTTGHTLTWLIYELAKDPAYQQRMVDEVDEFWRKFDGRPIGTGEPDSVEFVEFMKASPFMTKCITETLRLWPVVPNGTFRQLSYDDQVKGPGGKMVPLKKGTFVQITTVGRHRDKELWGDDANVFNPDREWHDDELWHDQVYAARNPHSRRFSPFTHTPRDCIGKNFAQMEMRTILTQLFKNFTFTLSEAEQSQHTTAASRGMNNGTMGPADVDYGSGGASGGGFGGVYGMHCYAAPRHAEAANWQEGMPTSWPTSRGYVPGLSASSSEVAAAAAAGKSGK